MADTLARVSEELAATVEAAGVGVVRIDGRRRLGATGIVWSEDGLVVTANHVLESDDDIKVGLPDGGEAAATLVGRDPTTDVAVLRADAAGLAPLEWSGPGDARVGNLVVAVGRPGKTVQATLGIVSALGAGWRTRAGGHIDTYLQTDVVMYPGFSGGPLVDSLGKALGLNTSALLRGVTVSIPAPTVRQVVELLVQHGRISRGYLGIGAQIARLPDALAKELDQETGLLLVSVEEGSPAQRAGLVLGDTVIAIDGGPVRQQDDLLAALGADAVGKTLPVKIVRGGEKRELSLTVGERTGEA